MDNIDSLYGPDDPSVLYAQNIHRSYYIFHSDDPNLLDAKIKCRTGKPGFYASQSSGMCVQVHERVVEMLYEMGFYGLYRSGEFDVDHSMITALVERWRPETHTFHFPVGEATVRLEDVAVIWGLPIRGRAIIGVDPGGEDRSVWPILCQRMLGFLPPGGEVVGCKIKLKCLREHMQRTEITFHSSDVEVLRWTRCAILLMLGCLLFPDTTGNTVSLIYLHQLGYVSPPEPGLQWPEEDIKWVFQETSSYSRGSATLAFLYYELCEATNSARSSVGGALQLLTIWAWIRLSPIRPEWLELRIDVGPKMLYNGRVLPRAPYGASWVQYNTWYKTITHNVRLFRDAFDRLRVGEFIWTPYNPEAAEYQDLPDYVGRDIWNARVPLINWSIVEFHYPEREHDNLVTCKTYLPMLTRQ